MKIQQFGKEDRPRERLLTQGAGALGNAELLAILLRTGTAGCNVLEVARLLLEKAGSLTHLSGMSPEEMTEVPGIGPDKAATISAALELARRFSAETLTLNKVHIRSPSEIAALMTPRLKGLAHEETWCLFLNRAHYIVAKEKLASGTLESVSIDSRAIVKRALEKKAKGIILVHNHPAEDPHPGKEDIVMTEKIRDSLDSFGIKLLDHIIICSDSYFSFSDDHVTSTALSD